MKYTMCIKISVEKLNRFYRYKWLLRGFFYLLFVRNFYKHLINIKIQRTEITLIRVSTHSIGIEPDQTY